MRFRQCEFCGANLDPCEVCDCKKEAAPLEREQPQSNSNDGDSIAQSETVVKPQNANIGLSSINLPPGTMDKDLVEIVRGLYPKYDKTLHSKVKRGDAYGITLRQDAQKAVCEAYGINPSNQRRSDNRTLPGRISCRLDNATYEALQQLVKSDGYDTMQSWLSQHLRSHVKRKMKRENTNEKE